MRYDFTAVKRARMSKGWSQEQLAKLAEVDQGTVSNVEAGKTNNAPTWKRIAAALGLKLQDLVIEEGRAS